MKWAYLFVTIHGHNKPLYEAQNMLVTTSDGRWQQTKLPADLPGFVNQLGQEGWELVRVDGNSHIGGEFAFKRPIL